MSSFVDLTKSISLFHQIYPTTFSSSGCTVPGGKRTAKFIKRFNNNVIKRKTSYVLEYFETHLNLTMVSYQH